MKIIANFIIEDKIYKSNISELTMPEIKMVQTREMKKGDSLDDITEVMFGEFMITIDNINLYNKLNDTNSNFDILFKFIENNHVFEKKFYKCKKTRCDKDKNIIYGIPDSIGALNSKND